ncbi:hypothetical protein EA473_11800 [Natrarchaeobius chitinivorans]|uniref:Uncharacterized protein n=1 Tax=Natrarchaeobius chitinivorans TaxID=1679083 RepID=A0A3N6LVD8_NATCH|nr:hypothetical protein EA473_11800 [Natrarchaeobius chitinivorans]
MALSPREECSRKHHDWNATRSSYPKISKKFLGRRNQDSNRYETVRIDHSVRSRLRLACSSPGLCRVCETCIRSEL